MKGTVSDNLTQSLKQTDRVWLLDGPVGTRLAELGFPVDSRPGWSARALVDAPELIERIHREYVAAGSQLITANTFRTHELNLRSWGQEKQAGRLTALAVSLARKSFSGSKGWVLGAVAPVGDCYSTDQPLTLDQLSEQHELLSEHLFQAGVDGVILETQVSLEEIVIAARAAHSRNLPILASVYTPDGEKLLDGTALQEVKAALQKYEPLALGVNCVPVERVRKSLEQLNLTGDFASLAYANSGEQTRNGDWQETAGADPEAHLRFAEDWVSAGVKVLGGCCGTGPDLIRRFSEHFFVE